MTQSLYLNLSIMEINMWFLCVCVFLIYLLTTCSITVCTTCYGFLVLSIMLKEEQF